MLRSRGLRTRALVTFVLACLCAALEASRQQVSDPPPRSSLPIVLVGLMTDAADPSRSACLIRCTQPIDRKSASMLRTGETACDLAEITDIRADAVVLRNLAANRLELLTLQDAGAPTRSRPGGADEPAEPVVVTDATGVVSVEIPKAAVEHYLVSLPELLSSAQATPRFRDAENGQRVIEGFELRQIRSGSIVEKVGLKDGDVIVDVNGETLNGLPAVMRLFGQAQASGQARLTVLRGSQRLTFVMNTR